MVDMESAAAGGAAGVIAKAAIDLSTAEMFHENSDFFEPPNSESFASIANSF